MDISAKYALSVQTSANQRGCGGCHLGTSLAWRWTYGRPGELIRWWTWSFNFGCFVINVIYILYQWLYICMYVYTPRKKQKQHILNRKCESLILRVECTVQISPFFGGVRCTELQVQGITPNISLWMTNSKLASNKRRQKNQQIMLLNF